MGNPTYTPFQETFHNGGFIVSWPTAINPSTKAR